MSLPQSLIKLVAPGDSVFNRLEQPATDPNVDDDYDSEFDRSTSSKGA